MSMAFIGVAGVLAGGAVSANAGKKAAKGQAAASREAGAASKYAADLSYKLGTAELDFSKQQYDENQPLANRISQQQLDIAEQTGDQGKDYYDYMKSYRPVEQSMMYESMGLDPDMIDALRAEQATTRAGVLGGLVDEAPSQAEYLAAQDARGLSSAQLTREAIKASLAAKYTTTVTDPGTPGKKKKKGLKRMLDPKTAWDPAGLFAGKGGSGPSSRQVVDQAGLDAATDKAFGEQTARQGAYTAAERRAAGIRDGNSALRDKANEAESGVFNNYASRAQRAVNAKLDAAKALDDADAGIIGGDDSYVYNRRRAEIDAGVGQAMAGVQGGYGRSLNQATREGLRYGRSTNQTGAMAMDQASAFAGASNSAREYGINRGRELASTNLNLRRDTTEFGNKQRAINWAKKLDAAGLVKGLPGASTGAYGLAVTAGSSALQNRMAPGENRMRGMNQGNNTIMSGANNATQTAMGMMNAPNYGAQGQMAMGGALMGAGTAGLTAWGARKT